jgi:predicted MFS family arabinose efflux permease
MSHVCESESAADALTVHEHREATRSRLAVLALAASAFIFVTAEVLPVGLLPQISGSLGVSEGRVGFLLTLYAALAGLSAIPLTVRTSQFARDRLLVVLMSIFTGSTVLAALAPTYGLLAASRLLCALAHGVFWATLTPTVARIVGGERAGRSASLIFMGTALATVGGVPLCTLVGVTIGWRLALLLVAAFGLLVVAALVVLLPSMPGEQGPAAVPLREVVASPRLRAVALTTAIIVIGQFTAYTYIAPLLREKVGLGGVGLSAVLVTFGVAGLVGNFAGGRFVDLRPGVVLGTSFGLMGTSYLLVAFSDGRLPVAVIAVVLWGLAFSIIPLCVQSAVLRVSPRAPDVASAVVVVAFQIGIGGGALLGGALVDAGHVTTLPWIGLSSILLGAFVAFSVPQAFPRRLRRLAPA